jgi:hypothetical protein
MEIDSASNAALHVWHNFAVIAELQWSTDRDIYAVDQDRGRNCDLNQ